MNPETSTTRSSFQRTIRLISILFVIGVGCGLLFNSTRQKVAAPFGPSLDLPTRTPTAQVVSAEISLRTQPGASSEPDPGLAITSSDRSQPVCGGPASMLVVLAGAGSSDYLYGLSDVIRIARLDFVAPAITVVSLPRDLWVEIPGIQEHYSYNHGKLNQAFFFGSPGMGYYDGPAGGPGLLALTLYHNYDLAVDHYFATNSEAAVQFVDALGGIDLFLSEDVDGTALDGGKGLGYFPAGQHHFDGQTALDFARVRAKYSDFKRQDNQSLLLMAIREKLLSPAVLPRLPALVEAFHETVLTDLSLEQIGQVVCLLGKVGQENILLTQLPKETYTITRTYSAIMKGSTSIVEADPKVVTGYLQHFAAGEWPELEKATR